MNTLLNLLIGFATTGVVVLAVIFVFNKVSSGGVANLGKGPLLPATGGTP